MNIYLYIFINNNKVNQGKHWSNDNMLRKIYFKNNLFFKVYFFMLLQGFEISSGKFGDSRWKKWLATISPMIFSTRISF